MIQVVAQAIDPVAKAGKEIVCSLLWWSDIKWNSDKAVTAEESRA